MADTYYVLFQRPGYRQPERRTVLTSDEAEARQVIMAEYPGAKILRAEQNCYSGRGRNEPPDWPRGRASVHHVWHALERRFVSKQAWQMQPEAQGRHRKSWWGLMQALEQYVKRHVQDGLQLLRCDDDAFMTSYLLLVPHETVDRWMGVTVVMCEQTKAPREFFLYPGHVDRLVTALQGCQRRAQRKAALTHLRESWARVALACARDQPVIREQFAAVLATYSELDLLPWADLEPWFKELEATAPHAHAAQK